jgi:hypothetical protein
MHRISVRTNLTLRYTMRGRMTELLPRYSNLKRLIPPPEFLLRLLEVGRTFILCRTVHYKLEKWPLRFHRIEITVRPSQFGSRCFSRLFQGSWSSRINTPGSTKSNLCKSELGSAKDLSQSYALCPRNKTVLAKNIASRKNRTMPFDLYAFATRRKRLTST